MLTKRMEKKLDGNYTNTSSNIEQVLEAALYKAAAVRPLTTIMKTIQVRRTRYAGHCSRSRDELISDEVLWTPLHGRPARSYIQHLSRYSM